MRKNVLMMALAVAMLVVMSGCAVVQTPVLGLVFTEVKAPITADAGAGSGRVGKATAKSFLGLVALGDASIEAAMKNGGIRRANHIDYQSKSILGVYGEFTVIVYGE
jgi:hypothetical protein